ncbi:MAG: helix-turn-helix domain-containing protein [Bacteroidota bacterium]
MPQSGSQGNNKVGTAIHIKEVKRMLIETIPQSFRGNKTESANILGFSLKTLHTKIQQYQIKSN